MRQKRSARPRDAGPAIGAFTTDVAVPALKYGADETTKAASAAASQVAVEASKVDWAGLAENALEQTVVFLVYVPVFAYTFAASLPAEEQFVLGLVVILVVGSFAKQDDRIPPSPAQRATDHRTWPPLTAHLMIKTPCSGGDTGSGGATIMRHRPARARRNRDGSAGGGRRCVSSGISYAAWPSPGLALPRPSPPRLARGDARAPSSLATMLGLA